MTKEEYLAEKETAIVFKRQNTIRQAKREHLADEFKLAIIDHVYKVEYNSSYLTIESIEQLKAIKKIIAGIPGWEMRPTPNVIYVGAVYKFETSKPEALRGRKDVISLQYAIIGGYKYATEPYNVYLYVSWFMPEAELPEEFTKDGCHFETRTRTEVEKSFVCNH